MTLANDINFNLEVYGNPSNFTISNIFNWFEEDQDDELSASAEIQVLKENDIITVERSLTFNNKTYSDTITADSWFNLFWSLEDLFDKWFDAVVNTSQNWHCDYDEDKWDDYKNIARIVFDDYDAPVNVSLVFTSVNNELIRAVLRRIEEIFKGDNPILTVAKNGAVFDVYAPVPVRGEDFYFTTWWKDTSTTDWNTVGDCDNISWLSINPISDMKEIVNFYSGDCDWFHDKNIFTIAYSVFDEIDEDQEINITINTVKKEN